MHVLHHLITRHAWLMFIVALALALICDAFMARLLVVGVALACALRVIGFVLEQEEDS